MAASPKGFGIGSCAACGISLTHNFLIKAACGTTFAVGCDCVQKTGDKGLVEVVKHLQLMKEKEQRRLQREADRCARLDAQRVKNAGLTDYELAERQEAERKEAEVNIKHSIAAAYSEVMTPIVAALEIKPSPFTRNMVADIQAGELPTGNPRLICGAIYGEMYAKEVTGVTRGTRYKAAKEMGRVEAANLFTKAEAIAAAFQKP